MKTLLQEHREEEAEAFAARANNWTDAEADDYFRLTRLLRAKDEAWIAYSAAQENERRQRCFGIVALVMLAIVVIGILVVINVNR